MIVIIDYKMGNIGSIFNMLKKANADVTVSSEVSVIEGAEKLILPGVGAFDNGMKMLNELGLIPTLNNRVLQRKTPILGICLGAQLLTNDSEEGNSPGLGWIDASTEKFRFSEANAELKIPHMGWNEISIIKNEAIFREMYADPVFYFVHSYHICCRNREDILTTSFHGFEFTSAIQRENIIGVQFHPEKSHKYGLKLLENLVFTP